MPTPSTNVIAILQEETALHPGTDWALSLNAVIYFLENNQRANAGSIQPKCSLCDDKPAPENDPCGACGKSTRPPADNISPDVSAWVSMAATALDNCLAAGLPDKVAKDARATLQILSPIMERP